jgi:hypothetical protein
VGLAILLVVACTSKPADPVLRALDQLVEAVEERDVDAVVGHLDPAFQGQGLDRAGAAAELRRYFALYEGVGLTRAEPEIERGTDEARVRLRVVFTGRPKKIAGLADLLPGEAAYAFDLRLRRDGERYLLREAGWERIDTGPAAPPG